MAPLALPWGPLLIGKESLGSSSEQKGDLFLLAEPCIGPHKRLERVLGLARGDQDLLVESHLLKNMCFWRIY